MVSSSSRFVWYAGHLIERRIGATEAPSGRMHNVVAVQSHFLCNGTRGPQAGASGHYGGGTKTVDGPLDVDHVELAGGVLPEGADSQSRLDGTQPYPGVAHV